MICKCKMYLYKNGVLVCSVCGQPAHSETIEDKIEKTPVLNKKKR